ncbi:MAG: caspase family protein [Minicystis sp.]
MNETEQAGAVNDGYALIIGAGDYRTFDASTGRDAGTSDLAGSTHDARALFRMCRLLRIPAGNIRVLASPPLRPEDLGDGATEENLGEATHDAILDGARWLAEKLDGPTRPTGILTWSGHGDVDEARGLVLCPSDTTGLDLHGAVPFTDLRRIFASPACQRNLTVLLDCCNAGTAEASVPTARGTSLTQRALPARLAGIAPAVSERTLCATAAGRPAYQAHFDGVARGAFTWAVTVAAEQWRLAQDGGNVYLTVSHDELIARAGRLLAALSIPQEPVLVAPARVGRMPVLKRGLVPHAGEAGADPTRDRSRIQLTGDVRIADGSPSDYVLYTLVLDGGPILGKVLVTSIHDNGNSGAYQASTEYWSLTADGMNAVPTARVMTIVGEGGTWRDPPAFPVETGLRTFTMDETVAWSPAPADPRRGDLFVQEVEASPQVSILWDLEHDGDHCKGSLQWYQTVDEGQELTQYVLGNGRFLFDHEASLRLPGGGTTYGTKPLTPSAPS